MGPAGGLHDVEETGGVVCWAGGSLRLLGGDKKVTLLE